MPDIQLHVHALEETDSQSRIVEAARDLIRARRHELQLEPFFDVLENAISQAEDDEFYCWSQAIDEIVSKCTGDRGIDEMRRMEWDYSTHFNQGLTRAEGADRLYRFLKETEPCRISGERFSPGDRGS